MDKTSKIRTLQRYVENLTNRLNNLPERYRGHKQYIAWVQREIETHLRRIEELKQG